MSASDRLVDTVSVDQTTNSTYSVNQILTGAFDSRSNFQVWCGSVVWCCVVWCGVVACDLVCGSVCLLYYLGGLWSLRCRHRRCFFACEFFFRFLIVVCCF